MTRRKMTAQDLIYLFRASFRDASNITDADLSQMYLEVGPDKLLNLLNQSVEPGRGLNYFRSGMIRLSSNETRLASGRRIRGTSPHGKPVASVFPVAPLKHEIDAPGDLVPEEVWDELIANAARGGKKSSGGLLRSGRDSKGPLRQYGSAKGPRISANERILSAYLELPQEKKQILGTVTYHSSPQVRQRVGRLQYILNRNYDRTTSALVAKRGQLKDVYAQVESLNQQILRRPRNAMERATKRDQIMKIAQLRDLLSQRYREQSDAQQSANEAVKALQSFEGVDLADSVIQSTYRGKAYKPSFEGRRGDKLNRLYEKIQETEYSATEVERKTLNELQAAERVKSTRSMLNVDRNFARLFSAGAIPLETGDVYGPAFIAPSGIFAGAHVSILPPDADEFIAATGVPQVRLLARNLVEENILNNIRFSAPRSMLDARGGMGRSLRAYGNYGIAQEARQRFEGPHAEYEASYLNEAIGNINRQFTARLRSHFESSGVRFEDSARVVTDEISHAATKANIGRFMPGAVNVSPAELAEELFAGALTGRPAGRYAAFKDIDYDKYLYTLMGGNRSLSPFEREVRSALFRAAPDLATLKGKGLSNYSIRKALQQGLKDKSTQVPESGKAYMAQVANEVIKVRRDAVGKDYTLPLLYEGKSAFDVHDIGRDFEDATERIDREREMSRLLNQRERLQWKKHRLIQQNPSPNVISLEERAIDQRLEDNKDAIARQYRLRDEANDSEMLRRHFLRSQERHQEATSNLWDIRQHLLDHPEDEVAAQRLRAAEKRVKSTQGVVDSLQFQMTHQGSRVANINEHAIDERLNTLGRFYGWTMEEQDHIRSMLLKRGVSINPLFDMSSDRALINLTTLANSQAEIQMSLPGVGDEAAMTARAMISHVTPGEDGTVGFRYTFTGSSEQREYAARSMFGGKMLEEGKTMEDVRAHARELVSRGWNGEFLEYNWHSIAPDPARMTEEQLRSRAHSLGIADWNTKSTDRLTEEIIEELPEAAQPAVAILRGAGEFRPTGQATELSQAAADLAHFGIRGANIRIEEAAQLPANHKLVDMFRRNVLIGHHVMNFMEKGNRNALITSAQRGRNASFIPWIGNYGYGAFERVYGSVADDLKRDYGIDWNYVQQVSGLMREGIPLDQAAREVFAPIEGLPLAQTGIDQLGKEVPNLPAPLSPWTRMYIPGTETARGGDQEYISLGEAVLQSRFRNSRFSRLYGRSAQDYDRHMSDAIASHMQRLLDPEVWRVLGETERGQRLQRSLIKNLPKMGQVVVNEDDLPEHLRATYKDVVVPALGNLAGAPGTTTEQGAKGTAAAENVLREAKRPVRAMVRPVTDLLRENRLLRYGAYGLAALGALGVIRAGLKHHKKDRTEEDMQGPPHLPGGNPYQGTLPNGQVYNAMGLPGYQPMGGSFTGNGMTYQVNARGSFDPAVIQSQIESITGANAYGNIYHAPSLDSGSDPEDMMRSYN